jgi:hypothetical protein
MTTPIDPRIVAPLVWEPFGLECVRAESAIGRYEVMCGFHNGQTFLDVPAPRRKHAWHHTIAAAKAAAQTDCAARIIAALDPAELAAMLAEARNDALREAADWHKRDGWKLDVDDVPGAILALIKEPAQ